MKKTILVFIVMSLCLNVWTVSCGKRSVVGEIIEHHPIVSHASYNFTGALGGIEFKLREYPNKVFRINTDSFDAAVKLGVMIQQPNEVYKFQNLTGWKVK